TQRKNRWPGSRRPGRRRLRSTVEVILRIYRLNDLARANTRRQTSRHGLSLTDTDVLAALRSAPPPHELSPTELYTAVLISSGGLTKVLHSLEHRGLIRRVADDKDRRSRRVRLTPAGRALAERAVAAVQASGDDLISRALSTGEMARLADLLRKLLLAVEPC